MPMDFPLRFSQACLGFGQHVGHLVQPASGQITHAIDGIAVYKTNQQIADVLQQRRIGNSQPGLKRRFGQASEVFLQLLRGTAGYIPGFPAPLTARRTS